MDRGPYPKESDKVNAGHIDTDITHRIGSSAPSSRHTTRIQREAFGQRFGLLSNDLRFLDFQVLITWLYISTTNKVSNKVTSSFNFTQPFPLGPEGRHAVARRRRGAGRRPTGSDDEPKMALGAGAAVGVGRGLLFWV